MNNFAGSKKIEVLLQSMFEGELDPEDEGPEESGETEQQAEDRNQRISIRSMASSLGMSARH